jgi:hypothetical protein
LEQHSEPQFIFIYHSLDKERKNSKPLLTSTLCRSEEHMASIPKQMTTFMTSLTREDLEDPK